MFAEQLAAFATTAKPGAAARAVMRLSLYDWMLCGLAGQREHVALILRAQAMAEGGAEVARLFGGGRVPARAAALVNGTISHALDYDDTHFAHIGHPSVAVIPAVLAVGRGDGAALVDAMLIGAEASVRVGQWLGRGHYQAGFHMTATAGAIGAAVAAARAMGLSPAQTMQALGVAATKAAGLKSQFGSMGKPLNAGLAAEVGVMAAKLAARGFVSNPGALDGPQGLGPTHHGVGDLSALDGLGADWRMETVSHKFHACCHGLHATLEALAGFEGDADAVEAVTVRTHPRWLSVCNIASPQTGLEAKFSYRHVVAMTLLGISTASVRSYSDEVAGRADIAALRDQVTVVPDEALSETEAQVELRVMGEEGSETVVLSHDLAAPMDLDQRAAKLRAKGRALVGETEPRVWNATARPESRDALEALMAL